MNWPSTFALRRRRAARRATGTLRDFYAAPPPAPATPLDELDLVAIDVETTGLDPARDTVLSVGHVLVQGLSIALGTASGHLVDAGVAVGQSATFHGITDDALARGDAWDTVVADAVKALTGRALLAHFAYIERHFLSRLCERLYGAPLVVPVVCTLTLHDRLINRGFDDEARAGQLRLWAARERFGLPAYQAHDALTDALACAELYLAQVAELRSPHPLTLRDVAVR